MSRPAEAGMILVTGADYSHGLSLRQFLASVRRFEPKMRTIVYDLGLTLGQRWRIRSEFPNLELRRFAFERFPAHLNIKVRAGEYAWKPVIVFEVLQEAQGPVCWMDAGNILTGPLTALRAAVRSCGFYSPASTGSVCDWTHPKMLAFFGLDQAWGRDRANLNGACVVFDPACEAAVALAKKWSEGALNKDCIAPQGCDLSNHRYDQALLTVLAHLAGLAQSTEHELLGFLIHQDVEWKRTAVFRRARRIIFPRGTPSLVKRVFFFFG
jgi:hypothetical protein